MIDKTCSIPFMFEKNLGQHKNNSKYVLRNKESTVFFLESEIVFALTKFKESYLENEFLNKKDIEPKEYEVNLFKMILEKSNEKPKIVGVEEFDCKMNYFIGYDEKEWTTDIPIYERLIYKDVYPGIDLVYYENEGILEHDFIVSPYTDINNIKINFQGVDKIEEDSGGNILIFVKENTIKMLKPKAYQNVNNKRVDIESNYVLNKDGIKFNIPSYDETKVLVIDPPILYGSYIGGNLSDYGAAVAVDANENAYITGWTNSTSGFPILNGQQSIINGSQDAFLIKIDTTLSGQASLKYGSYLGGNGIDFGAGVAVDDNENAYITGATTSTSGFPLLNAYQPSPNGLQNAFLIRIDTTLSGSASLKYGSYLGGNGQDYGRGIAVDANQNVYIAGYTTSTSGFPLLNAYQPSPNGLQNAFLIRIDTTLSGIPSLIYGTYLGGDGADYGTSVAADENKFAYIAGYTTSTNGFPILNAYQLSLNGAQDAFLIKIDTTSNGTSSLLYGTYLGGNNYTDGEGVAVDKNQNAYITGNTTSTSGFPLQNAYQSTVNGITDAFLIKINTVLSGPPSLLYGTYLGGNNYDYGYGVSLDDHNNVYITGNTTSTSGFPLKYAYQYDLKGLTDAFLIKINATLSGESSLKYGTYLGGNNYDYGYGIGVDKEQNAYITGNTTSTSGFPLQNALQPSFNGVQDAFLIKISTLVCDLQLEKSTCECKTFIGDKIPYSLKVTNNGPDPSTNIVVTDTFENGLDIISYTSILGSISTSGNRATWTIPELDVGSSTTCLIVAKTNKNICSSGVFIINTASLACDNTLLSASTTISKSQTYIECEKEENSTLKVEKTTTSSVVKSGEQIPYTIKISNNGTNTAKSIVATDIIDSNAQINSIKASTGSITQNNNTVQWKLDSLDVGEVELASIIITPTNNICNNYLINTVTLSYNNDSIPVTTMDKSIVYVKCPVENISDLKVEKNTPYNFVNLGEQIPYAIKISNNGPNEATNIVVTDEIDINAQISSINASTGNIKKTNNTVIWTINNLGVGEVELANILVTPNSNLCNTYLVNSVTLISSSYILNPANASDKSIVYIQCKEEKFSDLILKKSTSKCIYQVGEEISYMINIKNNGPDVAANVVMTDVIDSRLQILLLQSSVGNIENKGNLVIWKTPTLGLGEEVKINIITKVKIDVCNCTIENTANVKSDSTEVNNKNNTDSLCIEIKSQCKKESNLSTNGTKRRNYKKMYK